MPGQDIHRGAMRAPLGGAVASMAAEGPHAARPDEALGFQPAPLHRPAPAHPAPAHPAPTWSTPTRPGLRVVLAAAFGLLGLLGTFASSLAVGELAGRRIRADIGAEFAGTAERVADLLDRGLFERLRDIQVAASLESMADPAASPATRRAVLRRLQETYPDYALLMFIDPAGTVTATSTGLLEGVNVARRDYFRRGLEGPAVEDLHDAILMAPLLNRPPENPPRFVDLAAPVRGPDGSPVGVVAAHLFWEWAEGIERHVMAPLRNRHPGAEAFVLSREGRVLLGPPSLADATLAAVAPAAVADLAAGRAGSAVEAARAGRAAHLLGYAATHGHRDYPGLGWSVVVRHDAEAAFLPARELAREVRLWGLLAAALAALLGWLLAGRIARPLEELCQAAARLRHDPEAAAMPPPAHGPREVATLSATLSGLLSALRAREVALRRGEARLRLATDGAGIGAWEADLASGTSSHSPRQDAIFGHTRSPPEEWSFEAFLQHVVPADRPAVAAVHERLRAEGGEWRIECRIHRADDGRERWIESRGAAQRDPATGAVSRFAGVVEDITERKAGERAQELLLRELDHRVKNQFAVFGSLVQFTARGAESPAAMAEVLRGRLQALSAAHDLVRDASGGGPARGLRPTEAGALFDAVLSPFGASAPPPEADGAARCRPPPGRVRLAGPCIAVGPAGAAALALVAHELATNAARHGALSVPQGRVCVSWSSQPELGALSLRWCEYGGPALSGAPERRGFGTALVRQSATSQLGGQVRFDWNRPEGLSVLLELPLERLAR